jgi:hypothetical protein
MKRTSIPGVKRYKTLKEALGDISSQCTEMHNKAVTEVALANQKLAKGFTDGKGIVRQGPRK